MGLINIFVGTVGGITLGKHHTRKDKAWAAWFCEHTDMYKICRNIGASGKELEEWMKAGNPFMLWPHYDEYIKEEERSRKSFQEIQDYIREYDKERIRRLREDD